MLGFKYEGTKRKTRGKDEEVKRIQLLFFTDIHLVFILFFQVTTIILIYFSLI